MYWHSKETNKLIFFHLGNEKFGVINGPKRVTDYDKVLLVFEFEGCVCVNNHRADFDKKIDMWMLKDDCNTWVMIASITRASRHLLYFPPYSTRTGEVVIGCEPILSGLILHLYNCITQQLYTLKISVDSRFIVTKYVMNPIILKDL
ncbi:hypothetical protein ACHQM5_012380 [Ranunculus cassubicifolius]